MNYKAILIVDDEKNIRLTLSQTLETFQAEIDTAVNGEDALAKLRTKDYGIMLLDLKMPGMDGIEVLRRLRETHPDIRVVIITAHGTIDSAVEAMKLGAVDFIQKPFSPAEIRDLVSRIIDRDTLDESKANDYVTFLELSKRCISEQRFPSAEEHVRKAISIDNSRPEAFNLLGALKEIAGDLPEAQKFYRAALSLDPSFEPSRKNLERTTQWGKTGNIIIDTGKKSKTGNNT